MRRMIFLGALLLAISTTAIGAPSFGRLPTNLGLMRGYSGSWKVTFENGVKESCEIKANGVAQESEPQRTAKGQAARHEQAFVLTFEDGRIERWTPVGKRMVVEHWFPATQFPDGPRVLGIAERAD